MHEINLGFNKAYKWRSGGGGLFHVLGTLTDDDFDTLEVFIERTASFGLSSFISQLVKLLENINGFFSLAISTDTHFYLVADHIGSFPLYYRVEKTDSSRWCSPSRICISDDAYACSQAAKASGYGLDVYLSTFTVPEPHTFYEDVNVVAAGTIISIDKVSGSIDEHPYWTFDRQLVDKSTSLDEVCDIIIEVFSRYMSRLMNVPVVIPLTSGIDSRTIAVMLKKLGHRNMLSYTFGRPTTKDVIVGKMVAQSLDIPWIHLEANGDVWHNFMRSDVYQEGALYCCKGGRSVPGNSLLMLRLLQEKEVIPEEAVFIPGHTGGIAGGELNSCSYQCFNRSPYWVAATSAILECCMECPTYTHFKRLTLDRLSYIEKRLSPMDQTEQSYLSLYDSLCIAFYSQPCLANDVSAFEFYGYKWALPLMDKQWMAFWKHRSKRDLWGKSLMCTFINSVTKDILPPLTPKAQSSPKAFLKQLAKSNATLSPTLLYFFIKIFGTKIFASRQQFQRKIDELGFFENYTDESFAFLQKQFPASRLLQNSKIAYDVVGFLQKKGRLEM